MTCLSAASTKAQDNIDTAVPADESRGHRSFLRPFRTVLSVFDVAVASAIAKNSYICSWYRWRRRYRYDNDSIMVDYNIEAIRDRVLAGGSVTPEEARWLASEACLDALCDAAGEICRHFRGSSVDSCSIVNARSGLCGEDCKWCAQAARHHTGCETYNFIDPSEVMQAARRNEEAGIRRLSLVTSGRKVAKDDLRRFCDVYRRLAAGTGLSLCASMGLLGREEMEMLAEAGVSRYHCNMECSSRMFGTLCTTHTPDDKRRTIAAARAAGLEVCSGGIIGMGETMDDRVDFAFELAALDVDSVPVNVLTPIKGTPLEDMEPISEEEIVRTAAMMRFVLPRKALRFAGGRKRLSRESQLRMLRGGVDGVLMGDMLTTVSQSVEEDRRLFADAGLDFGGADTNEAEK